MLVTACPYCITHFEDSRLISEDGNLLEVKDITEVIESAI
jgi:Fe-S oxidoreductase